MINFYLTKLKIKISCRMNYIKLWKNGLAPVKI